MSRFTSQYVLWIILVSVSSIFGVSCKKDKVPVTITEPTKWELITGFYKVYDTLGVYLYDLQITHIPNPENEIIDSLRFHNFDGEFTFTAIQSNASNFLMSVRIGGHDTLYDSNHKRWKLIGALFEDYNKFKNDTIRLRFQKSNINYWVEDAVPYYACDCKQIAVKQH